jgi:transcriptional regulator with XRE-family HTH domain
MPLKERVEGVRRPGRRPRPEGETATERIGKLLRDRRQALGLSLEDVSRRTDGVVSGSAVSGYERGTEAGIVSFLRLCAALECDPLDLVPQDVRKIFQDGAYKSIPRLNRAFGERERRNGR